MGLGEEMRIYLCPSPLTPSIHLRYFLDAFPPHFLQLSAPEYLGAPHLAHNFLLRKPPKKQASNLRGLQSRLEALTIFVESRGLVAPGHHGNGVNADTLVGYW